MKHHDWPVDQDAAMQLLCARVYDLIVDCAETVDPDPVHRRMSWDDLPPDAEAFLLGHLPSIVKHIVSTAPTVLRTPEPPC